MSKLPASMERTIKAEIERTKCPVHNEHPKVSFSQTGFTVSCCCEKFRKDTIEKCQKAVGKALQDEITNAFKKLR
nr:hypothetical protein [uncultured Prevotella sp.]